jgi:hypothetical protein
MPLNIVNPHLANKQNVSTAVEQSAPSRDEQIETLRNKLNSPSTPDSVKPSIEAAIIRIAYRPRRREVIR